MKKKLYEKPTMKVVMLQQRTMLLAGSNGGVDGLDPFNNNGSPLE